MIKDVLFLFNFFLHYNFESGAMRILGIKVIKDARFTLYTHANFIRAPCKHLKIVT